MAKLISFEHINPNKKLAGFSLFETVIAITIITVLIGLGTMIYGNVMRAENNLSFYQAQQEIKKQMNSLFDTKAYFNQVFEFETYAIQQEVVPYKGNENVYQMTYTVTQNDRTVWKENHLRINPINE